MRQLRSAIVATAWLLVSFWCSRSRTACSERQKKKSRYFVDRPIWHQSLGYQHASEIFRTDYRAMHFNAKRGLAIACCLPSVRPSVRPSVTLVDCDHIGWNSSEIISPLVSLGRSLFATPTWRVCSKGNTPKFGHKVTPCWFEHRRHSIANCGQMLTDSATVTIESL